MSRKPIAEIHQEVIDRLNATHPSEDRSILVTQTVYHTIKVLKDHGFIDTEDISDAKPSAPPNV